MTTKSAVFEELAALFPAAEVVRRQGRDGATIEFVIPVLEYGKLGRICKILVPMIEAAPPDSTIPSLLLQHFDAGAEILAIALDKPLDFVNAMPPDLAAECIASLVRANADFFRDRVRPMLQTMLAAGAEKQSPTEAGPTP